MKNLLYIVALAMVGSEIGEEPIEYDNEIENPVNETIVTYDDNYIDNGDNNIWEDHLQSVEEDISEESNVE